MGGLRKKLAVYADHYISLECDPSGDLNGLGSSAFGSLQVSDGSKNSGVEGGAWWRVVRVVENVSHLSAELHAGTFDKPDAPAERQRDRLACRTDDRSDGSIAKSADVVGRYRKRGGIQP